MKIIAFSLREFISDFFPLNFAQKRAEKKNARDYPLRKKIKLIARASGQGCAGPFT